LIVYNKNVVNEKDLKVMVREECITS
jgi:hypothetical protein